MALDGKARRALQSRCYQCHELMLQRIGINVYAWYQGKGVWKSVWISRIQVHDNISFRLLNQICVQYLMG